MLLHPNRAAGEPGCKDLDVTVVGERRLNPLVAGGLVIILSLAGCSAKDRPVPPDDVAYVEAGDSLGAETTGVLRREGGCVYLDAENAVGPMVAVFQNVGIRWSDEALEVGGTSYPMGERRQFFGGATESVPGGASIPEACEAGLFWLMAQ